MKMRALRSMCGIRFTGRVRNCVVRDKRSLKEDVLIKIEIAMVR